LLHKQLKEVQQHNSALEDELQQSRRYISELQNELRDWMAKCIERDGVINRRDAENQQLHETLREIHQSLYWRATRPVAAVIDHGRRIIRAVAAWARALRRRKFTFKFIPNKELRESQAGTGIWQSLGSDPWFVLEPKKDKYPCGWVLLRLDTEYEDVLQAKPQLYVDPGCGFSEATAVALPMSSIHGEAFVTRLPNRVSGLRFDPMSSRGSVTLNHLSIQEIGKLEAFFWLTMPHLRGNNAITFLRKAYRTWSQEGWKALKNRIVEQSRVSTLKSKPYESWIKFFDSLDDSDRSAIKKRIKGFRHQPLISIIMPVYNTPEIWLRHAIDSVRGQLYPVWELCIADDASTQSRVRRILDEYQKADARIKVTYRTENGHISAASNSALELASGDFVALLDHDDELAEHALYMVAEEINSYRNADIIYSDEDKIDEAGKRFDPHFKSDWNPDLFYNQNFISHLGVYRTRLVRKVGGFRVGYEGSQDYDLCLRCVALTQPSRIRHIPHVLYHWRAIAGSTALATSEKRYAEVAAEKALADFFQATQSGVKVETGDLPTTYRAKFPLPGRAPFVSLIIPTRNGFEILRQCIESIRNKTTYSNYEIIIVDNQSDDAQTLHYLTELKRQKIARVLRYEDRFNFSAINNFAVQQCAGELVGLINNDVEVISPDWLSEMVSQAMRPEIGAVGAKLYYGDSRIQHAGVIIGIGGVAGHSHKYYPMDSHGYFSRLKLVQNLSAVTAACILVRREVYDEVGGLDEENLPVAFNDVDFCLRIQEAGYRNLWTPFAQLYHHESVSRGIEDSPEKQLRFTKETEYMKRRWGKRLLSDRYYSPNLSIDSEDFSIAWPPRVRVPWKASDVRNQNSDQRLSAIKPRRSRRHAKASRKKSHSRNNSLHSPD